MRLNFPHCVLRSIVALIGSARNVTILAASIGCFCFGVPFPGNAGAYKIHVLGDHRAIRVGHWDSLAWLDEKRLLFAAYDPRQPAALPNLYEWNLESDQVRAVSVTRLAIPPGPWIVGKHYFPTKAGMYFSSIMPGSSSKKAPGDSGGYLLKDDSVKRLFAGFVEVADVAPDGCRIAAVVDPYTTRTTRREIYVVNICD